MLDEGDSISPLCPLRMVPYSIGREREALLRAQPCNNVVCWTGMAVITIRGFRSAFHPGSTRMHDISYTVPPDLHRWSASLWQVLRTVFGTGMAGEKVAHSDEELVEGQLSFARWYASGLANCMNRLGQ